MSGCGAAGSGCVRMTESPSLNEPNLERRRKETAADIGGGTISINEMLQHESMAEFDEEEVKAMFASVDSDSSGELDLQAFTQMVEDMNIFDSFIDVLHKQKKKKQGRRDSTTRRPSLADLATMRKMADRWSAQDDDGW